MPKTVAFSTKLLTLQRNCKYKQCFICHALSYSRLRAKLETKNIRLRAKSETKNMSGGERVNIHNVKEKAGILLHAPDGDVR